MLKPLVISLALAMLSIGLFAYWNYYILLSDCGLPYPKEQIQEIVKTPKQENLYYKIIGIVYEDASNCLTATTRITTNWIDESLFECVPFCVLVVYQDGTACDPYYSMCKATTLDKHVGSDKCLDYYILKARKEWDRLGMDMCGAPFLKLVPKDQLLILRAYWSHKFSPSNQTLKKESDLYLLLTQYQQHLPHEN